MTARMQLLGRFRERWTSGALPLVVEHRADRPEHVCAAPSLWMGGRELAAELSELGLGPGQVLELAVPLDHETSPGEVCEGLFQQGLERGLVGDRPSADLWRPMKASDGAQVTGCSVTLRASNTGWGLQVRLAAPR